MPGLGKQVRRFTARVVAAGADVARHPTHLPEIARRIRSRATASRYRTKIATYDRNALGVDDALARVLGVDAERVRGMLESESLHQLMDELARFRVPRGAREMGGAAFLEACYALVRLVRPRAVLETGVALGYSTSVILLALEENEAGALFSVDLPVYRPGTSGWTGAAIPGALRASGRWHLSVGPDRRVVPELLSGVGTVDLCHYDSDKSYEGMQWTWRRVWKHLSPGGLLMADDVEAHDAFLDFSERIGAPPIIVHKPRDVGPYPGGKRRYAGLIRKGP